LLADGAREPGNFAAALREGDFGLGGGGLHRSLWCGLFRVGGLLSDWRRVGDHRWRLSHILMGIASGFCRSTFFVGNRRIPRPTGNTCSGP
jgi:hypothetical protein